MVEWSSKEGRLLYEKNKDCVFKTKRSNVQIAFRSASTGGWAARDGCESDLVQKMFRRDESLNDEDDSTATESLSDADEEDEERFQSVRETPTISFSGALSSTSSSFTARKSSWSVDEENATTHSLVPARTPHRSSTTTRRRMGSAFRETYRKTRLLSLARKLTDNQLYTGLWCIAIASAALSAVVFLSDSSRSTESNSFFDTEAWEGKASGSIAEPTKDTVSILPITIPKLATSDEYTIRIAASSSRVDLLQKSVDSHAECSRVKSILVDWQIEGVDPPVTIAQHASKKAVVVRKGTEAVSEFPSVDTDAVLLLDDDVVFACEDIDRAFKIWKQVPDRMVGFYAFRHVPSNEASANWWFKKSQPGSPLLSPQASSRWKLEQVPVGTGPYSILSDRSAFLHNAYLKDLDTRTYPGICQNLAMSVKVSSISGKPPVLVSANPIEQRSSATLKRWIRKMDREKVENSGECFSILMDTHGLRDLPLEHLTFTGLPI